MYYNKIINRINKEVDKLREDNNKYYKNGDLLRLQFNCNKLNGIDIAKNIILSEKRKIRNI